MEGTKIDTEIRAAVMRVLGRRRASAESRRVKRCALAIRGGSLRSGGAPLATGLVVHALGLQSRPKLLGVAIRNLILVTRTSGPVL